MRGQPPQEWRGAGPHRQAEDPKAEAVVMHRSRSPRRKDKKEQKEKKEQKYGKESKKDTVRYQDKRSPPGDPRQRPPPAVQA